MSDTRYINFVIERKQFTRELCSKIAYSLLDSHKEERTDKFVYGRHWSTEKLNDPKQWLEKEIEKYFYRGRNGNGIDLPYMNAVGSVWKVYDREDSPMDNWYGNIPKNKAVIVLGVEEPALRLPVEIKDEKDTIHESYVLKRLNNLIKDSIIVYNAIHPSIGITCLASNTDNVTTTPTRRGHIAWLTFFGPELVKKFGREKLLSAPAYKIELLSDGGILLISGPTPNISDKSEYFEKWDSVECEEKIAKHLGLKPNYYAKEGETNK
ncbi:Uncharacterised protein [uncultured archaeon]|nr:Uncharacterised protein [uncultured archaeon]